jgi:hypothetical protein
LNSNDESSATGAGRSGVARPNQQGAFELRSLRPAVTVIAFPQDTAARTAQIPGWIGIADTCRDGRFRLQGLSPGAYCIIAVDDVRQGEWEDPAYLDTIEANATRLTLGDGETKSVVLKLSATP